MFKTDEIYNEIFGNCVKISNDVVELQVTVDLGPRIIYCSLKDKENMFYQDLSRSPLGDKQPIYEDDIIRLYGGHRIWISPEIVPRCYYPDNKPVSFHRTEDSIIFTAPIEKHNNIQKEMRIRLDGASVHVENTIKNTGTWDIEFAPWCITMMDAGGVLVVPQNNRETGYLHNRSFSLWPYSDMSDERIYWGREYISLKQDANISQPFKFGFNNESGRAAYVNKGQIFCKLFETKISGNYPDNGCSFESYTNDVMLEIESLGEFVRLAPGETVRLKEEWQLYNAPHAIKNHRDESELKETDLRKNQI